jgi:type VI secretion system secreted protein Hcp
MGYPISVSIKGKKLGVFKGEGTQTNDKDKILASKFSYEVKSPRDAATGHASGTRQHSAIKIVKEWGAATPQIFTALVTNEVLQEVTLEFRRANANGEEYVYYRIKLTNASVSEIRQFSDDSNALTGGSSAKHPTDMQLEEVSFTFQKIEMESLDGKTAAFDDWSSGG